ncbi:hypothetical protein ACI77O_13665 [Pseudomonas tritici]|uniref:hypothetical protein n=1 Tax=Pseudomonas tritici TaxID=2745518 RepID=UPI00387B4D6F
MKHVPLILALALSLSGCDAEKELGSQVGKSSDHAPITLFIKPGYKMLVSGQPAPVFGSQKCPPADTDMWKLVGPDSDEGMPTCIVIAPDTETVSVTVGFPKGPAAENWTVERSGDRTMLRRPDGSYLAEAK